ncbi:protein kinase [Achlya hypogyna]|uniref:Protein kinase n=1 Tax=Achlya hypogyna TaxID=1202772 RepID=A0A1V9Z9R6_ACHHY|nr:protein kinase [Achlya hypogyna]
MLRRRAASPAKSYVDVGTSPDSLDDSSFALSRREPTVPELDSHQLRHVRLLAAPSANYQVFLGCYYAANGALDVAVKRLTPKRQADTDFVLLFVDHIHLLARLRHVNVVAVVGVVWNNRSNAEVALEYMDQGSLRDLLTSTNPLTVAWAEHKHQLAADIARALAYLHSQDVAHQQLSMDAVLLSTSVHRIVAKLSGIAFQRDAFVMSRTSTTSSTMSRLSSLLRNSTSCFSYRSSLAPSMYLQKWMAPEVLRGERATAASDMYSFGVFLSVLDTHEDPYKHHIDMDDELILQRISYGVLRPTLSVLCPPGIAELALACLEPSPLDRPTALTVQSYLETPRLCSVTSSFTSSRSMTQRRSLTVVL